jgi:hypothetical protein
MVNLQGDGTLKKIQDDYLYWDKIKHTKKNSREIMECSALYRFIRSNTIPSGKKILLVI